MMSGENLGGGKDILNIDDGERWRTKSNAEEEERRNIRRRTWNRRGGEQEG